MQKKKLFQALLLTIVEAILPKTKIEISHQKIIIETKKAKIEIDNDNIKLEAKGDIELKAGGKISLTGSSIELSPKPIF